MRLVSLLTAATLAVVPQAAFAACELEPAGEFSLPSATGKTAEQAISGLVTLFKPQLPGCTDMEIAQALIVANNWQADTKLGEAPQVRAVRPKSLAPVAAQPITEAAVAPPPVAATTPAPQSTVEPEVVTVSTEVLTSSVSRDTIMADIAALEDAYQRLQKQVKGIPGPQLSAEQLKLINELPATIARLEGLLTKVPEQGTIPVASMPQADRELVQVAADTKSMAETFIGREALDVMAILGFLGLLGVMALAGYVVLSLRKRVKAVEEREEPDLSNFVSKDELEAVKADVADVREQGGFKVIMLEHNWHQTIMQLAEGEETDLQVFSDSKASHTILVRRGSDDTAFILSGIGGHVATNAVKVRNLQSIVRTAANPDNFRLNNPINPIGLAAVA